MGLAILLSVRLAVSQAGPLAPAGEAPTPSDVVDQGAPLPPGHPKLDGPVGDAGTAMAAKDLLKRLDEMKAELKGRPKTAEIEFALGNLYYDNGRWPDAIDAYRQLLTRAAPAIQRDLAWRQRAHRKPTKDVHCTNGAAPTFETLITAADHKADAGDLGSALVCAETALLPLVVALNRQGNAWYLIGNEEQALAAHHQALEIAPDDVDALFFLGAILFEGGEGDIERLKQAKANWQRFLKLSDPSDLQRRALATKDLVRVQLAIDNHGHIPPEAPPQMRTLASGPIVPLPAPVSLTDAQRRERDRAVAKGQAALAAKRWKDAKEAFQPASKLDRGDPVVNRGLGVALLNLGDLVGAEAAFRDALGRDPSDAQALYELGEVFFRAEHYAGAAKFWLQVLDEDPKLGTELGLAARVQDAEARQ